MVDIRVTGLVKSFDLEKRILDGLSFQVDSGERVGLLGRNGAGKTTVFRMLTGELEPDEGSVKWGVSTIRSYLPKDNSPYFDGNQMELVDWLRQYSAKKDDVYLRGFLGRMLFSNEDLFKPVNVLSGGEKVRCMLSRMMLFGSNVLILDQPTNHLDLESITAVNNGLSDFKGNVLFCSHDYEIVNTVANRIIEICDDGVIDHSGNYDDFVEFKESRGMEVTTL